MLTRNGAPVPRPARQPVLLVERKNHVNGGVHFDGIAMEKSRLIAPLADSIQRGIHRLNAVDNARGLNVAADAEWASLLGLRRWWCSAHAANDAAQHATHRAAGNAAGDSTAHARGDVGLGVFLNNFDIVGNDFWLHELAGIHQMGLWLHVDYLNRRGWRRWRRRRR